MGNIFSQEEKKEIAPHFQGIDPVSLARVIWDCINEEGMDSRDEDGNIGISFDRDGTEEGKNNVLFWDNDEPTSLPKNVFLSIMKMTGEEVVKTFEDHYDLERSKELAESVSVLKEALENLEEHMSTIESEISPEEYRKLVDDETEPEEIDSEDERPPIAAAVEDIQVPQLHAIDLPHTLLSTSTADAEDSNSSDEEATPPPAEYLLQRRRSTKGMVGVMDRLPELRRRVDEPELPTTPPVSPPAFDKDEVSPEETLDDKLPSKDNTGENNVERKQQKSRSSSVDNFFKQAHPKHQLSTASLPGDLSVLRQSSHTSLLSPGGTPIPLLPGCVEVSEYTPPTSPRNVHIGFSPTPPNNSPSPPGGTDKKVPGGLGSASPTPPRTLSTNTSPSPPGNKLPSSNSPSPPGSMGDKLPGSNTPTSPGSIGNRLPGSNTPTPPGSIGNRLPGSNTPTPPGSIGNRLPGSPTPPGSIGNRLPGSNSPTPPGSIGNRPLSSGSSKKLSTPSSSLDTNSPTPPPGADANRFHLAWAKSLESISSGTPPVSMGPQNFPTPEYTDFSTTLSLPGSVENSSPPLQ